MVQESGPPGRLLQRRPRESLLKFVGVALRLANLAAVEQRRDQIRVLLLRRSAAGDRSFVERFRPDELAPTRIDVREVVPSRGIVWVQVEECLIRVDRFAAVAARTQVEV